ncbi:hypothetical protein PAXINDRAFT_66312, partial [Paxillus involutus ATCC 200175]
IARLKKGWTSHIYAFFKPTPVIKYIDGQRCHAFKCLGKGCKLMFNAILTRVMQSRQAT